MTLHDVVTLFCVVAIASASPLADQSNDLIVGGLNGPVNFSRPEGERLFYFYVPSTYLPSKPFHSSSTFMVIVVIGLRECHSIRLMMRR